MLVLSRRCGEGVTIGPGVRVVLLGMKGGQVR
ncbi:MAG: carbon storage regulator, partial [Nitrospira sp.]